MKFTKTHVNRPIGFLIFLSVVIFHFSFAMAEEKAEGGGEGEAGAEGASPEGGGGNRSDKEWAVRTNKLNKLEQQIKDGEKKVKELIEAKNGGHHAPAGGEAHGSVLEALVTAHREMKKAMEDYEVEKRELVYRFPEEGALINRKYLPMRPKTLDQLEKELGLDGELTRLMQNIDRKYVSVVGPRAQEIKQADKGPESTLKDVRAEKEKRRMRNAHSGREPASTHGGKSDAEAHKSSSDHGKSHHKKITNNKTADPSEHGNSNHTANSSNKNPHGNEASIQSPIDEDINDESGQLRFEK